MPMQYALKARMRQEVEIKMREIEVGFRCTDDVETPSCE